MAEPYASALELAALDELRQRCSVLQQAHDDLRARFDVAKQEDNCEWSSKLGRLEDVRHPTQHCFADSLYGSVALYLRRKKQAVTAAPPTI